MSSLLGAEISYPQPALLVASVAHSDPIAQAVITASAVTPDGSSIIVVSNVQADDHGDTPATATPLTPNNEDVPGRIDRAGDVDVFKITPAETGRLSVRVSNLGMGMQPRIRILTANSATVLGDFTLSPTATSYFFTWLQATAGQPFYVEVSHVNSSGCSQFQLVGVIPGANTAAQVRPRLPVGAVHVFYKEIGRGRARLEKSVGVSGSLDAPSRRMCPPRLQPTYTALFKPNCTTHTGPPFQP